MGEVYLGMGSRYEVTVVAPTALCLAAIDRGNILVGFLARGHVAASCPAPGARMGVCFRCGEPVHVTKDCEDKRRCPICVEARRSRTSHRTGSWECPLVPPIKGRDIILGGVVDRQGKSKCAKNVPKSAGAKTVVQGAVHSAGLSVDNDMEVEQANLNHARRAQDLLGQRMRETGADMAIVSEPCVSRLLDELEELLGTFPALPALVAGDFNARFPRWVPEGRSNPSGELLCMWANRLNLSLGYQVGHPTCVRPQGSSVVDLTHEAIGSRGLRSRDIIFPKWNARAVDEDRLAAALVSGEWIRDYSDNVRDLVK
ncbi:hypothetical protein M0804_015516 [Polistes exclamans]|nr:hypothetical protein M0804_015516 [Polistes exclamans]